MSVYPVEVASLDNGLHVAVAESPSPGVAVNLWYAVGAKDEPQHRTGFAHLFEHLMFQGSANVAPGEHMALIESVGGTVNATTSSERTNYFETVPRGALELALWLEADRMASLDITQDNFEAQRAVVKEEKRERYDNQPYGDLLELIVGQHFPADHPYGHLTIGSMAHLDEAHLDDVAQFFDTWYRPSNARLVLAGSIAPHEGFSLAERYFGHLPALEAPATRAPSNLPMHRPSIQRVDRDVPYTVAYLSWATSSAAADDQPALDLALSILADGHASRLHGQLVKGGRGVQETHAVSLPHRHAPSLALLVARPTDGATAETATHAVRTELARFIADGPTEGEFDRALAQHERSWLWQLATVEERADLINEGWLLFDRPDRINTHLEAVFAVTPDDVRSAAARWLDPNEAHELHYRARQQ